ncbi:MAG: alpha/beta fold hydrolase, partial [Actinobacteria bacterium]|nr:alpha/beta fold hydrolase [Actinomycetota bacterium]
ACSSARPAARQAGSSPAAGSGAAAAANPAGRPPGTLAGYYAQKLRWQPCNHGFQCARMWVPFDYHRPGWRRFSLPVIKLPASHPSQRIGSLVVNPGGPGGSGIQYALQARSQVSAAVRARFDVVGFDPRGVGESQPAITCLSGPQLDKYFATSDNPANAAQLGQVVSESKLFARGCQQHSGPLLPYVGTANAARDMDVLRAALGDAKLTYLGKSYGTYLGAWYAQLFPTHVRALVLDGAVDPAESGMRMNAVQAQGFEVALRSFTANCLTLSTCPLGHGSVAKAIGRLQGLLDRAARKPLSSNISGQPGDAPLLLNGVAAALYSKSYWSYLRSGLTAAFNGDGTLMVELGDLLVERSPNGHYSNLTAANTAVNCVDRPWPRSLTAWQTAARAAAKKAPQFGAPIMWGSLPCAYWPVKAAPVPALRAAGAPPILVVGTTRDPATPFRDARALAGMLRSGVLLAWNGDGHTAYRQGSSCVDSAVDQYLIHRTPPRNGAFCG